MCRHAKLIVFSISALLIPLTEASPPKLGLNDVAWLWPAPNSVEDLDKVISIATLNAEDGSQVWSDQQFEDVLKAADSDSAKVGNNRIRLPDAVRAKSVWRIAAFRADPTAPGGHELIRKNFGERPQLRLILQPVTVVDNRVETHDIAVHLVYSFLKKNGESAELPDRERFKQIIDDLDALKKLTEDADIKTGGQPLGVHPGLKAGVPGLQSKLQEFLSKHLRASDLNAMAIMGLDGPEPWIFLALSKFPPGAERFGPIPFLPAQMLSFGSGNGAVLPPPKVNNLNPVLNKLTMPEDDKDRLGVATAVLFGDAALNLDALGVVGKDENGDAVRDEKVRNRDIPDLIADPVRSHFFNTDCLSCHTETRRRLRLSLPFGEFAFRQDGEPPKISADVLPKDDWNVRNLGWFPPSRFIGGGPTVPTVTQRTANETAEVVQFIERQYRHDPSPGPEIDNDATSDDADSAQADARIIPLSEVEYLDQGWNDEERKEFYYLSQGSQLVPYNWFLNLEIADSRELLRSNRHMRSLGCITQERDEDRNPDGLPIGFVKDSNPSSIAMKAGFLGPNYNRDHYPSDDWLGLTCAACHTSELTYEGQIIRIDGGAALIDVEGFLAAIAASMRATADDDEKFHRFEERIKASAGGDIDTTSLRQKLQSYTPVIERLVKRNKAEYPYGLGRLDAFGAILNQICEASLEIPENRRPSNAPVSYPFLWDTPNLDWVQWNSSAKIPIFRNVGEVLGVFAHVNLNGTLDEGQFSSSARIDYLHQLETRLGKLRAPAWPEELFGEIDKDTAEAGKRLFAANCASCHNMRGDNGNFAMTEPNEFGRSFIKTTSVPFKEIGTDAQMVLNFVTRTAEPGDLKEAIQGDLDDPITKEQLEKLEAMFVALGRPRPDFSQEVPAAMLLKAAVRGVIARDLEERFQNRTEDEKRQMLLDLKGHRTDRSPPNGGAGYKARPLNGVWATAPFGHAGVVPNLYQWLLPENERVKSLYVGNQEFDTKNVGFKTEEVDGAFLLKVESEDGNPIPGNSNKGHSGPGKTDFSDEQRWQLIEYIKTLR